MRTTNEIREKIVKMYLEGYSIVKIMAEVGVRSTNTIFRVLDAAGVKGAERQERNADVLNITLTDAAVVQWLRSQPNAAEAITKLVYSQIEGSSEKAKIQKQKTSIAVSTVETIKEIPLTFLDERGFEIGKETLHVPEGATNTLFLDLVQSLRDSYYPKAVKATNENGHCTITFPY